jgi:addiction module RelE/StbE family toxin
MPKLSISPEARKDLKDIQAYISEKLESPKAAFNTVSGIIEKIKTLLKFPEKGTPLSSQVPFTTNYRFLKSKNYLIFYRYENGAVFVIRIIYARRDYIKILFPELNNIEGFNNDEEN